MYTMYVHHRTHMYTMYFTEHTCTPCIVQNTHVHHVRYRAHMYTIYHTEHTCTPFTIQSTHVHHLPYRVHMYTIYHAVHTIQITFVHYVLNTPQYGTNVGTMPTKLHHSLCSTGLAPREWKSKIPIFQKTTMASIILIGERRSVTISRACIDGPSKLLSCMLNYTYINMTIHIL